MAFVIICSILIIFSFYLGYKHGRNVERIDRNLNDKSEEMEDLFIKDCKCDHEWKTFSSGYKQCKKCRSIVKNN